MRLETFTLSLHVIPLSVELTARHQFLGLDVSSSNSSNIHPYSTISDRTTPLSSPVRTSRDFPSSFINVSQHLIQRPEALHQIWSITKHHHHSEQDFQILRTKFTALLVQITNCHYHNQNNFLE
jgi:hypothetical protein